MSEGEAEGNSGDMDMAEDMAAAAATAEGDEEAATEAN